MSDVARDVSSGTISLDAGKERARQLGAQGKVTRDEILPLAESAANRADEGDWRFGQRLAELAYAAGRAAQKGRPDDLALTEAFVVAGADVIYVLEHGLQEHGDIRLYSRAVEVYDETHRIAQHSCPH